MKINDVLTKTKFFYHPESGEFHEVPEDTTFALFAVTKRLSGVTVPPPKAGWFSKPKATDVPVAVVLQQAKDAGWVRMALLPRGRLLIDAGTVLAAHTALNRFMAKFGSTSFQTLDMNIGGDFHRMDDKKDILTFANHKFDPEDDNPVMPPLSAA